ncbi:hypothetical protein BGZ76_000221 [Entomortierella beljakovae]|nr:hypothetical protein BGZ76_000221 [Entomortierella beljakovae]
MVVGDHIQSNLADFIKLIQPDHYKNNELPRKRNEPQVGTYNVLLLGETQSGKSTFIEAVKQYADPEHKINQYNIGNGVHSLTKEVICYPAYTYLPTVSVVRKVPGPNVQLEIPIHFETLLKDSEDYEDYESQINERKNLEIKRTNSSTAPCLFNLFDTPGLNDTDGHDESHIAKIFQELKAAEKIHLVLITIGQSPFTKEFISAIQCYIHMFPEFQGVIAFLHTHTDYKNLHPERENSLSYLAEKKERLNAMMGRKSCTHFYIDCDLSTKKPIRISMTQNIIQRILRQALVNEPVVVSRVMMYKTPKMQEIDDVLIKKFDKTIETLTETVRFKNDAHATIIDKLYHIGKQLEDLRSKKQELDEYIRMYNTDDLIFIEELTSDQVWRVFHMNRKTYAEFSSQEHLITKINVIREGCSERQTQGGEGFYYWRQLIKRRRFKDSKVQAKFYTTKSRYFRIQISSCKSQLCQVEGLLPGIEQEQVEYASQRQVEQASINDLLSKNKLCTRLIARLSDKMMKPEIFQKLIEAEAYSGSPSENIERVERIYTEMVNAE